MNIHNIIKKVVKENKLKTVLDENSLSNILLLSLSQDTHFNNNYSFFQLSRSNNIYDDEKHFVITTPYLSRTNGSNNNIMRSRYIDISGKLDEQFDNEPHKSNEKYLFNHNIDILKKYKTMLKKSESFNEFQILFEKEVLENNEFIHKLDTLLNQNNKSKLFFDVFTNLSQFNIDLEAIEYDNKLKSELNIYSYKDKTISSSMFIDILDDYDLDSLLDINPFSLLKKITLNDFSNNELKTILRDEKTNKIPEDIQKLIKENESKKNIIKEFNKKYKNNIFSSIYRNRDKEKRKISIFDGRFDYFKNESLNEITAFIENTNSIDKLLEENSYVINKLKEKIIERIPEINNSVTIDFEIIETNGHISFYSQPLLKYIKEKNAINIFPDLNDDLIFKGLHFLTKNTLNNNSKVDKKYIFMKNKEEIIGFISLNKISGNDHLLSISNVQISDYYKNKGFSKKLYQELANYAIKNNFIISSNLYSQEGKKYLPSVKKEIIKNNPNLLLLELQLNSNSNEDIITQSLNINLYEYLTKNKINPEQIKEINTNYKNQLKIILNEINNKTTKIKYSEANSITYNIVDRIILNINNSIKIKHKKI